MVTRPDDVTRAAAAHLPTGGRRLLAASSAGGHFKQLVRLVDRIPDIGHITWVTYDSGLVPDLLRAAGHGGDAVVFAPYAAPRDLVNLARNMAVIRRVLRSDAFDLAVSTGSGIAVAALPLARAMGVRACFIESAARTQGPSLSGRILERCPGIDRCTQHPRYPTRWRYVGSVSDDFVAGPRREGPIGVQRVVVSLGTSEAYGFRRLVERLIAVLPAHVDVLWQTGATDTTGLGIDARPRVPGPEFEAAVADADVVVAHAGMGSALTCFEKGVCPVLVPRRSRLGENVDDHQEVTANDLVARGLAISCEADELSLAHLEQAASRTVTPQPRPQPLEI